MTMGLYVNQKNTRSELQQRLDAELRAKAAARSKREHAAPDGVDDSAYIKGTKQTTSLAWAWLLIFFMAVGVFILFVYRVNTV